MGWVTLIFGSLRVIIILRSALLCTCRYILSHFCLIFVVSSIWLGSLYKTVALTSLVHSCLPSSSLVGSILIAILDLHEIKTIATASTLLPTACSTSINFDLALGPRALRLDPWNAIGGAGVDGVARPEESQLLLIP